MTLRYACCFAAVLLLACFGTAAAQERVDLEPTKDNTLYEDNEGEVSNGAGVHFFVGRTNQGRLRRALVAFDVAGAVPSGVTIDSVRLSLDMNQTVAGAQPVALHRVTADWGEGTSNAGASRDGAGTAAAANDATWIHTFFNTGQWAAAGGDFASGASATINVGGPGSYAWSGSGMTADVQSWLDAPGENFGWILIGNEDTDRTAKRFVSREGANAPVLSVFFSTNTAAEGADEVPDAVRLAPNYPNPFRAATTISYELAAPKRVTLDVFDALGRHVTTLVDDLQGAGTHQAVFDAEGLPPGIYVYRLDTGGTRRHRTMILLR